MIDIDIEEVNQFTNMTSQFQSNFDFNSYIITLIKH